MSKFLNIIIPITLCLIVGFLGSLVQESSIVQWYPLLNKSPLTPPNMAFPVAWTILYVLMGVSIGVLINKGNRSLIALWGVQLLVNFLWSVMFFMLENPLMGLIDIFILDALVFMYIIRSYKISKPAAYLFIPYMVWILFASYLNLYIYIYN